MIELKNVSKIYHNNKNSTIGLHNVSVSFHRNEIVAVTGESGSGKTTLLNVIAKMDSFDEGEILYYGKETSYYTISEMDDFRKNKVGFIFQNYNILDAYTVLENVMLPLLINNVQKEDAKKRALQLIDQVGLSGREYHKGTKLSGGEKQRCVIARALASNCDILVCDEPTGNLDSVTSKQIIDLIKEVAKDKLVIIVTHNFDEVKDIITRQIKMSDGKIVEDISYLDYEKEEIKEVKEDKNIITRKTLRNISINNFLSTPKKTVLTTSIIFVICFLFLFLLQTINSAISLTLFSSPYPTTFEDLVFVYDSEYQEIDLNKLDGYDYEINSFSTFIQTNIVIDDDDQSVLYATNIPNSKLVYGRKPENDSEFIIAVNKKSLYMKNYYKDKIGETLKINAYQSVIKKEFTLVGVVEYTNENNVNTYITQNSLLKQYLDFACSHIAIYENDNFNYSINTDVLVFEGNKKPKLVLPIDEYDESNSNFTAKVNGYELELEIAYDDIFEPSLYLYTEYKLDLSPYFILINCSNDSCDQVVLDIEEKGYNAVNLSTYNVISEVDIYMTKLIQIISSLQLVLYLFGLFFITYVILNKIYVSRKNDYEILRTLGIRKKDMSKIVNFEIVSLCFITSILTYILFNVLIYLLPVFEFLRRFNLIVFILYFISMYVFSLSMAHRFNKRLFKFSVRESMKGEEDDD